MITRPIPSESVVVFADLQLGIGDLPLTVPSAALNAAVTALAKLAALRNVPVLVSTVPDQKGGPAQLIPALADHLPEHQTFPRTFCDSYENSAFRAAIEKTGRKSVIISGVATEVAVALPAFSLAAAGYDVFVVVEACGGLNPRGEEATHKALTAAGVHLISIATLAGVFAEDFSKPEGYAAIEILFEMAAG